MINDASIAFKKILKEMKPHAKIVVVVLISGAVWSASQAQYAVMVKSLFDNLEKGKTQDFWQTSLLMIAMAFVVAISRYLNAYLMTYTSELVAQGIRQKLHQKFMRLNLNFYNNFGAGTGGLLSRILNDVIIVKDGTKLVADFFREPLLVIFLLVWLLKLNWRLTLGILIILPVISVILKSLSRSIRKYGEESQVNLEKITSTIKETLDGIRIIQSFNLESEMERRFQTDTKAFIESRKKVSSRIELGSPVTELIATFMLVGLLTYLLSEIGSGRATYGDFASYIMAVLAIGQPIRKIQESYTRFQEAAVAARRVYSIIEDPSVVPETENPVPFPKYWSTIEYRDVSFAYGDNKILDKVSFEVKRGQVVALVGESGSGKSTIVNLLERFFDSESGEILIDGIDIRKFKLSELRQNIGLVSQDVFLFSDTVKRNIMSGDFSRSENDVPKVAAAAHASDFILRSAQGFENRVGDRGGLLSGGEKQRISIARAFFKNAPILILDEATSALDSVSEQQVQEGLDVLSKGRTTFVIAHRLSTVSKADLILVMKKGRIIERGSHQDLLNLNQYYSEIYSLQSNNTVTS